MVELINLSKTYMQGENLVYALDHIHLILPDTGFVFIVGKSGCGKSTLLNLVGGLDDITEGDVVCDGNHLSSMTNRALDDYRNVYAGFVFQNYCLIEDLTVGQNIALALDIQGEDYTKEEKNTLVESVMQSVDLELKFKDRLAKQLSAGQKQRVAIARTLIKNPKLILADEPTGNLDAKTAKIVLNILKKLSSDRLVVIVSHNQEDALTYADRIITLSDGKIVADIERDENNINELTFAEGVLTLPSTKRLTKEDIALINQHLAEQKIKEIGQHGDGFEETKPIKAARRVLAIERKKISFKNAVKLSGYFSKKRIFSGIATVLAVSMLVFILGLCQFLLQFNTANAIYTAMEESGEENLVLQKGYFDKRGKLISDQYIYIDDEDIAALRNSGYTGNIYKIYRNPLCIENTKAEQPLIRKAEDNLTGIYVQESFGTLVCDEAYLNKQFGYGGTVELLAESMHQYPYGILIPDYVADSILFGRPDDYSSYESLISGRVCDRRYINGIFKTDYKEKFKDLFAYIRDVSVGIDRSADEEYFENLKAQFLYEVETCYGLAYSTNPNFGEDIKDTSPVNHTYENNCEFRYGNISIPMESMTIYKSAGVSGYVEGDPNDVAIEYDIFNHMFGDTLGMVFTEETYETFQPVTVTLNKYHADGKTLIYSKEVTIAKLLPTTAMEHTNKTHHVVFMSEGIFAFIHEQSQDVYRLLLDDSSQLDIIFNVLENDGFSVCSNVYKHIHSVGEIVDIFESLFSVVLTGIALVCVILLVNYGYGNIKKRNYEIGVLKALGANAKSVGFIFNLQIMIAGVSIILCSTLMLTYLCEPLNLQISNRILDFVDNTQVSTVMIIQPYGWIIVINMLLVLCITAISCLLPFRKLNKIKPKNIITEQS